MASKLEQVVNDERFDDIEDSIIENCGTYEDYGRLLVELMEYNAGTDSLDSDVLDLLTRAVLDYMADAM